MKSKLAKGSSAICGKSVVLVISGGNLDIDLGKRLLKIYNNQKHIIK